MIGTLSYIAILWLVAWQFLSDKQWFRDRFRSIDDPKILLPEFRIVPFVVMFSIGSLPFVNYLAGAILPDATFYWIYELSIYESDNLEVAIITALTFAPLVEEIGFRGFLFDYLTRRKGIVIGIFINAIAFGLVHKYSFVHATVVGIILSIVYFRTSNIFASVIIHALVNLGALSYKFLLLFIGFLFPHFPLLETFNENLIVAFVFLAISFVPLFNYFKDNLRPLIDEYGYGVGADNEIDVRVDDVNEVKPQESIDTV